MRVLLFPKWITLCFIYLWKRKIYRNYCNSIKCLWKLHAFTCQQQHNTQFPFTKSRASRTETPVFRASAFEMTASYGGSFTVLEAAHIAPSFPLFAPFPREPSSGPHVAGNLGGKLSNTIAITHALKAQCSRENTRNYDFLRLMKSF